MVPILQRAGLAAHEAQALAWAGEQARLDEQQLGHLRRIRNLAARPCGDWPLIGPTVAVSARTVAACRRESSRLPELVDCND